MILRTIILYIRLYLVYHRTFNRKNSSIDSTGKDIHKIHAVDKEKYEVFLSRTEHPIVLDRVELKTLLSPIELYYLL